MEHVLTKPDVLVVDFYCVECGHRPGKWMLNGVEHALPVQEESSYVRKVAAKATHVGCGGSIVIATEPIA